MSLKYKILWFEDNCEIVSDYSNDIKEFLEDLGFQPIIVHKEDGKELEVALQEDFDLILTDLNLGEDSTGDKLIEKIRDHSILTEVLFYSGNAQGINNIITKHQWIERVSFSVGIENLPKKIKQLISLTIKKLQEANTVRGIVMAETSELDMKMLVILNSLLDTFSEVEIVSKKQELIDKTVNNRKERYEKMSKVTVEEISSFCERLESYDKLNAIRRLIKHKHKDLGEKIFSNNINILNDYETEVINMRNALAHAKEITIEGKTKVVSTINGSEISFDDESCKKIRKDIRKHSDNFDNICEILQSL
ncbi:response regulator [Bacillus halotolerans]|uniref:response regulator n=1 Tax=Bacillus halotolerans TaxID=260554 RepID=UPI0003A010C1|nr:response regulator [Bacillus halotolerans]UYO32288.1 response regulator [Bacillus halotolerans]